jgi:hypothetical protein
MITQKERDERNQQSKFDAAVEAGIEAIYVAYSAIRPCEGSRNMLIEICNRWAGQPIVPTPELLRTILDENPNALSLLALQDVDSQRGALVDEICALLASSNDPNKFGAVSGGKYSPADIKALRNNILIRKTRDELVAYRDDIQRKQVMSEASVSALKQVVRDALPKRRLDGYPQMPAEMVFAGEVRARKVDAECLKALVESDYEKFRKLVKLYGVNQVNERLQGR